jgi:hypothetical protein
LTYCKDVQKELLTLVSVSNKPMQKQKKTETTKPEESENHARLSKEEEHKEPKYSEREGLPDIDFKKFLGCG